MDFFKLDPNIVNPGEDVFVWQGFNSLHIITWCIFTVIPYDQAQQHPTQAWAEQISGHYWSTFILDVTPIQFIPTKDEAATVNFFNDQHMLAEKGSFPARIGKVLTLLLHDTGSAVFGIGGGREVVC